MFGPLIFTICSINTVRTNNQVALRWKADEGSSCVANKHVSRVHGCWSCDGTVDAGRNGFQFGMLSPSDVFWLSQFIFSPRHPASPPAPLGRCLAPGVPGRGGAALRLLAVLFCHTLSVCGPHELRLFSLLRGDKAKWVHVAVEVQQSPEGKN